MEESMDVSWMQCGGARRIGETLNYTDVGPLRDQLNAKLTQSLLDEFVDPAIVGEDSGATGESSIFDYGSSVGLLPEAEEDHWLHDKAASTWTRVIVVPRKAYFHPEEGRKGGPSPEDLGDMRKTITADGRISRDDWRKADLADGPEGSPSEWVGSCVFRESWSTTSEDAQRGFVDSLSTVDVDSLDHPGSLVFTDVPEYSLIDDLTGEDLPGPLVTIAKREEITEMYRRTVWEEEPIESCFKETGKPPIPVRWVVTNKGDKLHPNIRCRLVAKHLVAKYGGKDMEDLFAAMPPFELVKALLVKAAQRRDRRTKVRKVMFIDVSKAHLYAPVGPDDKAYVALPVECEKPGVCGRLGFWLYGMRPASAGWQEEYTRQLAALGFVAGIGSPCCFVRETDGVACVVHGDDFTFEGPPEALRKVAEDLKKVWIIKVRATLGPEAGDDKEVSILNRIVRWMDDCLLYEADPRHVEKLLREAGLENCKSLSTPGVKESTDLTCDAWFEESGLPHE